jgi:hypothetical protein
LQIALPTAPCTKKFRDFKRSGKALAQISDRLCLEYGLSIIENPKRAKGHYGKWLGDENPLSHSEKLRQTIDEIFAQKPKTFRQILTDFQDWKRNKRQKKNHSNSGELHHDLSSF